MTTLSALLDSSAATTLAWTLLHFLWQGTVLAVLLAVLLKYSRFTATGRYAAGVATLALMLAAPAATFTVLSRDMSAGFASADAFTVLADSGTGVPVDAAVLRSLAIAPPANLSMVSIVVALWAAGVLVLAIRLIGGWWLARGLVRRGALAVAPEIESMAVRIAGRLALDRVVRVAQSSAVAVPVMIGWLKPIVLFPASVLGGLSPTQIEALLAHELAHVRRHDYLVNLLQSVVETMLFYHPAVWWVSGRVRVEREHCCDDIALGICDRLVYATALSDLAALAAPPQVALAATDGSLLERVRRILAGGDPARERGTGWLPVLGVIIVAGLVLPVALLRARADQRAERVMMMEQTAVRGGVSGGVSGGVAGGVAGGVQTGVPGGVSGGVAGESERRADEFDEQARYALQVAQSEQNRVELARRLAALQAETDARLREIEEARAKLVQQRIEARFQAQVEAVQTELEALVQERARMRRMVEQGTLTENHLADNERQIRLVEQKLRALQSERNLEARELELRVEEERRQRELERAMIEIQRTYQSANRDREIDRQVLEMRQAQRQIEERRMRDTRDRAAATQELLESTPLAGNEPIRSGDLLVIEISGEPDVPRAHTVSSAGTIRLPLSAPIRVADLTGDQVKDAIAKQLSARGLERADVEVQVRRPRRE
jgi:beta-lactamase regulating signal transducer with metallopeptidase domain